MTHSAESKIYSVIQAEGLKDAYDHATAPPNPDIEKWEREVDEFNSKLGREEEIEVIESKTVNLDDGDGNKTPSRKVTIIMQQKTQAVK